MGWIKEFTYDPDSPDNDFLLSMTKRVNDDLTVRYKVDGQGVYINTRNLRRIEFVRGFLYCARLPVYRRKTYAVCRAIQKHLSTRA
jgi:hypothetical protein